MQEAHANEKGAIGLGGEMIDAPMIKQVNWVVFFDSASVTDLVPRFQAMKTIAIAEAAGLPIPDI